jgi:hypothetical protein
MSEVPKIIEDFLKGNNDAGGTVAKLEEEASRLVSQIESLETTNHRLRTENDNEYDAALEWAASWITGAQLSSRSEEVQEYARNMAMSIRAAKRGLTKRAPDLAVRTCKYCDQPVEVGERCHFHWWNPPSG